MESEAKRLGADTDYIHVTSLQVHPCTGCMKCRTSEVSIRLYFTDYQCYKIHKITHVTNVQQKSDKTISLHLTQL